MIKAYVLTNCQKCEELKSYMRRKGIAFVELNVETNPKALAKMTLAKVENYPAIEINGKIYSYDVGKLKRIIG